MDSKAKKPLKIKKPWKGAKKRGPTAARHIPWPEIFKHHISLVEGHLRMMEMIQKHTTPGTGNYESITAIVKRTKEILHQTKDSTRSFVQPKGQRESVPLGSSSYSMYPGYSPEDIQYGEAAHEAGQAIGEMRKQGVEWDGPANGAEYKIGQAHGSKRKYLFQDGASEGVAGANGANTTSSDEGPTAANPVEDKQNPEDSSNYFVIDTNPTPVTVHTKSVKESKKRALEGENNEEVKKPKKSKKAKEVVVETEDISANVDAKLLQALDEETQTKKEKKRRRSSDGADEQVVKKQKKEKSKKREADSGNEESGVVEKKKKKKSKSEE